MNNFQATFTPKLMPKVFEQLSRIIKIATINFSNKGKVTIMKLMTRFMGQIVVPIGPVHFGKD